MSNGCRTDVERMSNGCRSLCQCDSMLRACRMSNLCRMGVERVSNGCRTAVERMSNLVSNLCRDLCRKVVSNEYFCIVPSSCFDCLHMILLLCPWDACSQHSNDFRTIFSLYSVPVQHLSGDTVTLLDIRSAMKHDHEVQHNSSTSRPYAN